MRTLICITILLATSVTAITYGCQPPRQRRGQSQSTELTPQIAWHGVLKDGIAESQRTGKPIFLISAACQCIGVSGIW